MLLGIIFKLKSKGILVINLTMKEKNDLGEVYDCLLVNNKFNLVLNKFYKISVLIFKKYKKYF